MTAPASTPPPRWRVLVEGASDAAALTTLAARLGRDLAGVAVVPMHGITNLRAHLRAAAADGVPAAGLYDAAEERVVRRTLAVLHEGAPDADPPHLDPARTAPRHPGAADLDPAAHHLYRCERDLEDELIRACTPTGVLDLLAEHGDLARFRAFQRQPFQRPRPLDAQLRRFLGTTSGRKIAYGGRLAAVVPLERTPPPIRLLLDVVSPATRAAPTAPTTRSPR